MMCRRQRDDIGVFFFAWHQTIRMSKRAYNERIHRTRWLIEAMIVLQQVLRINAYTLVLDALADLDDVAGGYRDNHAEFAYEVVECHCPVRRPTADKVLDVGKGYVYDSTSEFSVKSTDGFLNKIGNGSFVVKIASGVYNLGAGDAKPRSKRILMKLLRYGTVARQSRYCCSMPFFVIAT
ncbi:hypothetical protein MAUB1S_08466 [Mycolicibacterium aubagnense]